MATRTAAVDFSKVYSSLQLGKQTVGSLQAFRKRTDDARRQLAVLKEQRTDVDLAHYKKVLRVSAVFSIWRLRDKSLEGLPRQSASD